MSLFLFTPPFTQLNTPYPATAYLKGFLSTKGIACHQADLGIEVTNAIFSKEGLGHIFSSDFKEELSENAKRILALKSIYLKTIDSVMAFLQGKQTTLARQVCQGSFLPQASRFQQVEDVDWAYGVMGIQDKAKHLCTLYLEDISDFIKEAVDEHFGFSRYAERLGRSANSFDELYDALQQPLTFVDSKMLVLLEMHILVCNPNLVGISVPFPGNLYAAFRCAQYLRRQHPAIKIAMGGGFANTELRSLKDARVFEFFQFITLDDGESPLEQLIAHADGEIGEDELKRTFLLRDGKVHFVNNPACSDYKQGQVGTPDYGDLPLDTYISAIEVANPMHSLWSDGRWNKLTMAHGCYWGKCTFCDTSLDYIARYEPLTASLLADRMEELVAQTGENGFHFVDEAAPPALMRALALEILRRGIVVTWWANIRFEKSFTRDLCLLLSASGCIAVSGGLEVASDRLLALIQKGITVQQVAKVNKHFAEAGIMVHAYLMYGFPTQTAQETIDSLEMVRQLFTSGVLQSAFWHLFTMTVHSPIGLDTKAFKVEKAKKVEIMFANNDVDHLDPTGTKHEEFGFGLRMSLHNYMQGACLDYPLQKWFEHTVPKPSIPGDYIAKCLSANEYEPLNRNSKVVFLGQIPDLAISTKTKKGNTWEQAVLTFYTQKENVQIKATPDEGKWLTNLLPMLQPQATKLHTIKEIEASFVLAGLEDFDLFWTNKPGSILYKVGLLTL